MTTPIYFCKVKDDGEVIAIFPTYPASPNNYEFYSTGAFRGECPKTWVRGHTLPATETEYAHLMGELVSLGYDDLVVADYDPAVKILIEP